MRTKVALIGTAGLPANYGGFESLAEYLTKYLGNRFDITVYCSGKLYENKIKSYNSAQLKYIPLHANGVQSIPYDIISIFNALFYADVLLILGVSGCVIVPFVKLISRNTIVVNIDGLEWKRAKWGKAAKWFLKYSEKLAVKYADTIISDNKVIQQYVKDSYGVTSELIAYGADHASIENLTPELIAEYPFLHEKYAFKVCRIEPENNIEMILDAFSSFPALSMVLIGNWNNSNYGKTMKEKFKFFKNIHLLDPIYDQNILNQIRSNCFIYVHGHSAGGTNPSLVEAMYLGLPIISFGINYNIETTENKALYFNTREELIKVLINLDNVHLKAIADNMEKIAIKKYSWSIIAEQYALLLK